MKRHRTQEEWDIHFMRESRLWSYMSKCLSRKIGTVLVRDNRIIATGYNGPPSGIPHCDYRNDFGIYTNKNFADSCPRQRMGYKSGEGLQFCPAIHAEINPILQAAKSHVSTVGATLYCYCGTPCINCAKEIVQAGIKRVVCLGKSGSSLINKDNDGPHKKKYNFSLSEKLFELAGVKFDVVGEDKL